MDAPSADATATTARPMVTEHLVDRLELVLAQPLEHHDAPLFSRQAIRSLATTSSAQL